MSEYPFLVDIRRKPTGKEGAAALSRLPRPSKIMSHLPVSARVRARVYLGVNECSYSTGIEPLLMARLDAARKRKFLIDLMDSFSHCWARW